MDTSVERIFPPAVPKKQRRSVAKKRRVVEETFAAGASVARVARAHNVNANQVFHWRKLYQAGRLGGAPAAVKLLPVSVEASPSSTLTLRAEAGSSTSATGTIHIKLGQAQIRVEGHADPGLLRMVLESLRR